MASVDGPFRASFAERRFKATLTGLGVALGLTARRYPQFAARLRERDLVAQIMVRDRSAGRHFSIKNGKLRSSARLHPHPDVTMVFESIELATRLMKPDRDYLDFTSALKTFQMSLEGSDELGVWFSQTIQMMVTAGQVYGEYQDGGVTRFTNNTNRGRSSST